MNIAFVNATSKWGGVKTWMLDIGQALHERGHSIFMYGRQTIFTEQAKARSGHGMQLHFGADLNPCIVVQFVREFRRHHMQVVFVNVEKDLATAGVAAKLLGIPVIQRIGLPHDIPRRLKTRLLHAWIHPLFFCPCQYIARGFVQSLPYVHPEQVHTLLTAKTITTYPLVAHTPRRLIVTQQLNADKGHRVLLEALASVSTPFVLHVVGTGNEAKTLKEMSSRLGLDDRIVWHGFTTDVPALLRQSDIFLLASLSEGLPNTLLEALAHGLLPIVRDVGGVREVLTPQIETWILPYAAQAEDFRTTIERALALPDEDLIRLKKEARLACSERCDMRNMVQGLEKWLQEEVIDG